MVKFSKQVCFSLGLVIAITACIKTVVAQKGQTVLKGNNGGKYVVNDVAVILVSLESKGKVLADTDRNFLRYLSDAFLISPLEEIGFDYNIDGNMQNWKLFVDGNYYVITGAVSKNSVHTELFSCVLHNNIKIKTGGKTVDLECFKLGNKTVYGAYPKNIIPYKFGTKEQLMPRSRPIH